MSFFAVKYVNLIYKAESVYSLFTVFQQIWTKFGMWHPYIPRMVMVVEFYL